MTRISSEAARGDDYLTALLDVTGARILGEVAFGLSCVESCLMPLLQLGHALFQACDARLELSFVGEGDR